MPNFLVHRDSHPEAYIYYEIIGEADKPTIVMQHGDGNASQDWKSLGYIEKLSPYYRLLLIDYLGFGESFKGITDPDAYTMPLLASDTIALLRSLGLTNVIFFGGSMGARVGYELATNPDHAAFFKAFILNGMRTSENDLIIHFGSWAEAGGMERVVTEMEKYMAERFPPEIRATFLRNDPKVYAAANKKAWPPVKEKLREISKPVLFMCGACPGNEEESTEMEEASTMVPGSTFCKFPDLDHAQAYWYAKRTVPEMLKFIESVLHPECLAAPTT